MPGKIREEIWQARYDQFVKDAIAKHGDRFSYHRDKWFGNSKNSTITCKQHGDFIITPFLHITYKNGCRQCADLQTGKWNSYSFDQYVTKANKTHNNAYSYDEDEYDQRPKKITINCKVHGGFQQTAVAHSNGHGCPKCGILIQASKMRMSFDEFIKRAVESKGDKFDNFEFYEDLWQGSETHTTIKCNIHGLLNVRPCDFLGSKHGCEQCADTISGLKRRTPDSVLLSNLNQAFPQFEYSNIQRINGKTKVDITCSVHGVFTKGYHKFITTGNCPGCTKTKQYSNIGTKWLKSLGIESMVYEYRLPEKLYQSVDGYDPVTNTVYQFHGDFWHGNPKFHDSEDINPRTKESFGTAYERTLRLNNEIQDLGYNLVVMWQSDFK